MASSVSGKPKPPTPPPPSITDQQLMMIDEQNRLEHTQKTGKGSGKLAALKAVSAKFVSSKIPNPAILPKQANVANVLAAYVASATQQVKKTKKKDPIDEVMEAIEECLDGIIKEKGPASEKHASKIDEFKQMFSTCRHYYELLEKQSKSEEELVAFTDALYNRLSQNKYTQQGTDLREILFELPGNVFYSQKTSLLNELVFSFVIHILIHPKQRLTPLRSILKSLGPEGLPDISRKLKTFPEAEQAQILKQIARLGPELPFNKSLPKILGAQGIETIAQWTFDYLINQEEADRNNEEEDTTLTLIERLIITFGDIFLNTLIRGGFSMPIE